MSKGYKHLRLLHRKGMGGCSDNEEKKSQDKKLKEKDKKQKKGGAGDKDKRNMAS